MPLAILGLGTANPPGTVNRDEALMIARVVSDPIVARSSFLVDIYAGSGVDRRFQVVGRPLVDDLRRGTRESGSPYLPGPDPLGPPTAVRMQLYADHAPPLALRAAREALADGGVTPAEVTHLVTVSCTGFTAPNFDHALIRDLGLRPTVQRTHVGYMGCHGAINGLRVAAAFAADPTAVVMLAAVELCSLHYYYGMDADKVVANALFADGAAAVVGQGSGSGWRVTATGSCVLPDSAGDMGWEIGDHGFEMILTKRIPKLIQQHLRPWLEAWLGSHGLSVETVGSWAVHPGGPRILTAVEEGLNLPPDALAESRAVLREYGNMSSPTVLFILDRLRKRNAPRPVVLLGFGPGLVAEAAVVE
jgi:predicted naringenin-chalcone synthase